MAGLVPAIHVFALDVPKVVDARDKRGHDVASTLVMPGPVAGIHVFRAFHNNQDVDGEPAITVVSRA